MDRIVLEVSKDMARKWNAVSASGRNKILTILNDALDLIKEQNESVAPEKGYGLPSEETMQSFKNIVEEGHTAYERSLKQLRAKAKRNGLTEEILEHLLNE